MPVTLSVCTENKPVNIPAAPEMVEPNTEVEVTFNVLKEDCPVPMTETMFSVVVERTTFPPNLNALVVEAMFMSPAFITRSPETTEVIIRVPAVRLSMALVEALTLFRLSVEVVDTGFTVVTKRPPLKVCCAAQEFAEEVLTVESPAPFCVMVPEALKAPPASKLSPDCERVEVGERVEEALVVHIGK